MRLVSRTERPPPPVLGTGRRDMPFSLSSSRTGTSGLPLGDSTCSCIAAVQRTNRVPLPPRPVWNILGGSVSTDLAERGFFLFLGGGGVAGGGVEGIKELRVHSDGDPTVLSPK